MMSLYEPLRENEICLLGVYFYDGVIAALGLKIYLRNDALEYDAVSYAWSGDLLAKWESCNGLTPFVNQDEYLRSFEPVCWISISSSPSQGSGGLNQGHHLPD